jgi:hypothetical protein
MDPLKPVHKTNVIALVIFSIATLIVAGVFLSAFPSLNYNQFSETASSEKKMVVENNSTSTESIDADIESSLNVDNTSDLETIDSQF